MSETIPACPKCGCEWMVERHIMKIQPGWIERQPRACALPATIRAVAYDCAQCGERVAQCGNWPPGLKMTPKQPEQRKCASCGGIGGQSFRGGWVPCDACNGRGY